MPAADAGSRVVSVGLSPEQLRKLLDSLDSVQAEPASQKRRSRRLPYRSLSVHVDVLDTGYHIQSSFEAATRNISSHGMAFVRKQAFAPGQLLRLAIPLIDSDPIRTLARVVRCRHLDGMIHEIGVEFVQRASSRD